MRLPYGLSFGQAGEKLTLALGSRFPTVRKEAASALGKLSRAFPQLRTELNPGRVVLSLMARLPAELHPQVRQFLAKALGKYGADAAVALDDLRDQARDLDAPAYVRTSAAEAIAAIQLANREKLSRQHNVCSRCHRTVLPDEYLASMNAYGHCYCRHCADEIALESQNFELMVEDAKRKRTQGGTAVQSRGEKRIAEFLERERIAYSYDARYRVAGDVLVRPDFYLPEFDLYIEYWGMDTPDYNRNMEKKRFLYQRAGKKLISVSWRDLENVEDVLREKLSRYVRFSPVGPASEK